MKFILESGERLVGREISCILHGSKWRGQSVERNLRTNCNGTVLWLEFLAASRYAFTPFTANWLNITKERTIHILGPQKHMLIPSV